MDRRRRVIREGAVGLKGSVIAFVGQENALKEDQRADKTIDGTGMVMLPGLIDTHAHAGHGLTKTLGEGGIGIDTSWDDIMERIYFQGTEPDFWYAEGLLSGLEKLRFGVTTGMSMLGSYPRYDDEQYWQAHVEGMVEIGIRDILGVGTPNPPFPKKFRRWTSAADEGKSNISFLEYELSHEESFAKTRQAVKMFHDTNNGLTLCYPTPSGVGRRDPLSVEAQKAQNRAMKDISLEFGVPVHAHSYGGDIRFAREHFPFILSENLSLAHCTGIDSEEIQILADTGTNVCSGPSTGSYIKARCPVVELLDAGCNVSFCTDASAPDRTYDLFEKMRMGARLHRVHFHDSGVLPAGKLLEMVTIDAAVCLGLDDRLGSIEEGKLGDIILIDMTKPHLYPPWQEPLRMVYQASGHDVDTVIVNGRVLMQNRKVSHVNQEKILAEAEKQGRTVLKRLELEKTAGLPATLWGKTHY